MPRVPIRISTASTAVLASLLLAACATQPPAPVEDRSVAEQVRAPAAEEASGLQVYPLQNPAVAELADAAGQAEDAGDLDRAVILLERALRIEPRDPELLQYMAEVQLERGAWEQADSYASRSFDVGPRVGELCQRNWRTMALARERMERQDAARQARERLARCQVEVPERF
ncbi:tetratricopeptide repeat protein [Wenzhouxiangella sp. AB-CW3]|uniref:tetratricopeptide repeat protein n=1 Tax=Wenzhouxiangella sp. AB-CW3 TaxID=2771012 RepID=UPI00168B7268|nr:tetratricopeptide repeat protein [Wenzhouxiangella sp. AB-CW3]QOC21892.1 tetratricopeptide repeat protein [Wenzhouxiangella sp. AB-CW3]